MEPLLGATVAPAANTMFVRYYVNVERSLAQCARAVLGSAGWLDGLAGVAEAHTGELLARVGFKVGPASLRKQVRISMGPAHRGPSWVSIPIRWQATGPSGLFPTFDGDLQLIELGPFLTKLAVGGTYRAPTSGLGRPFDSMLRTTAAEATIQDFLESVAARLGSRPASNRLAH